jgi:CheY-like chemotaxis protein
MDASNGEDDRTTSRKEFQARKRKYDFQTCWLDHITVRVTTTEPSLYQSENGPLLAQVISIIDDDASVREATRRLLRSLGHITRAFASAEEFLRSSQVDDNSCLITDVKMPGMSGVELQRHLQIRGCHVPLIFITSFSEESIRTQALNAGAVCFLSKPVDIQRLIKHLDEALKRRLGAPTSEFLAPVQRT